MILLHAVGLVDATDVEAAIHLVYGNGLRHLVCVRGVIMMILEKVTVVFHILYHLALITKTVPNILIVQTWDIQHLSANKSVNLDTKKLIITIKQRHHLHIQLLA